MAAVVENFRAWIHFPCFMPSPSFFTVISLLLPFLSYFFFSHTRRFILPSPPCPHKRRQPPLLCHFNVNDSCICCSGRNLATHGTVDAPAPPPAPAGAIAHPMANPNRLSSNMGDGLSQHFFDPEGGASAPPGSIEAEAPAAAAGSSPPPYEASHMTKSRSGRSLGGTLTRSATRTMMFFAGASVDPEDDIADEANAANNLRRQNSSGLFGSLSRAASRVQIDPRWQNTGFFARSQATIDVPDVPDVEADPSDFEFVDFETGEAIGGATAESLQAGSEALREIQATGSTQVGGRKVKRRRKKSRIERQREAFTSMKTHKPYFIQLVTFINVFMLMYAIYINGDDWDNRLEPLNCNPFLGPSRDTLISLGAKVAAKIKDEGEAYRFITPIFSHVGLVHLAMNMSFQVRVGWQLEEIYGSIRIGLIYMISGIGGNMLSCIFVPSQVQVGASGALYGILGILLSDLIQNWSNLQAPCKNLFSLLFSLSISLGLGLLPVVDNFAHVGGFIPGIFGAIIFLPTVTFGKWQTTWKICLVLIALPCLIIYFAVGFFVFYNSVPTAGWCDWCQYVSCLPIGNWCEFQDSEAVEAAQQLCQ